MVRHLPRFLILLAALPATAGAQRIARPFPSIAPLSLDLPVPEPAGAPERGVGPAIGGAALGGLAGVAAGFAIGYPLIYQPDRAADLRRGCEDCGLGGALGTAALMALTESVGIAVGAHLGDGRRGRLGADIWTSVGGLVLGALVAGGVGSAAGSTPAGLMAVTIPIVQIAAAVAVERHTARVRSANAP